jgi:hypothetical protein
VRREAPESASRVCGTGSPVQQDSRDADGKEQKV